MIVKCLTDKGEIDHTECLACARAAVIPPCNFEYSFLSAQFATFGEGDRSNEIHVTDIVHCIRKSFLDKTAPVAETPAEGLAKFRGIAIHDFMEGKNSWAIPEQSIVHDGVMGRTDVLYESTGGEWVLADYKTARQIYTDRLPYAEHELQMNFYAYMMDKQGKKIDRLVLVYFSNAGPSTCSGKGCKKASMQYILGTLACPVCGREPRDAHFGVKAIEVPKMRSRDVEQIFRDRKMGLEQAMATGALPVASPGWLCGFCKHYCDARENGE
jgi:CRISPR/Cas system-associated exonuclease Cas4 (RecB family)